MRWRGKGRGGVEGGGREWGIWGEGRSGEQRRESWAGGREQRRAGGRVSYAWCLRSVT